MTKPAISLSVTGLHLSINFRLSCHDGWVPNLLFASSIHPFYLRHLTALFSTFCNQLTIHVSPTLSHSSMPRSHIHVPLILSHPRVSFSHIHVPLTLWHPRVSPSQIHVPLILSHPRVSPSQIHVPLTLSHPRVSRSHIHVPLTLLHPRVSRAHIHVPLTLLHPRVSPFTFTCRSHSHIHVSPAVTFTYPILSYWMATFVYIRNVPRTIRGETLLISNLLFILTKDTFWLANAKAHIWKSWSLYVQTDGLLSFVFSGVRCGHRNRSWSLPWPPSIPHLPFTLSTYYIYNT